MNGSQEFEDARRREAADPLTAPHRLAEIAHDYSRFAMLHVAPLVASNPNAPFDLLCELAGRFPREVLANSVLQLLYIEDPRQFAEMPVEAALMLLREETPAWLVDALAGHDRSTVREAAQYHVQRAGASSEGGDLQKAISQAILEPFGGDKRAAAHYHLASEVPAEWLISSLAWHRALGIRRMIASNKDISPSLLIKLADDPDESVKIAVAGNPHTPSATLISLAGQGTRQVLAELARRKDLTAELALLLARENPDHMRINLAENVCAPPASLAFLAKDDNVRVRECVAKNPSTPATAQLQLAADPHPKVREAVARNLATPEEVLDQLANDENDYVPRAVAHNPQTSATTLARLAQRRCELYLLEILAARHDLSEAIQMYLAGFWNDKVRAALAANEILSEAMLERLAGDPSDAVREAVAANPATPRELIACLAQDDNDSVSRAACMNPFIPVELLIEFAQGDVRHRLRAAQHPHTPAETIMQLVRDTDHEVQKAIMKRADLPLDALPILATNAKVAVHLLDKTNPYISRTTIENLAKAPELCLKALIAGNSRTDIDTLTTLAQDTNGHIRCIVALNPSTPIDVLIKMCNRWEAQEVRTAAFDSFTTYVARSQSEDIELPIAQRQSLQQILIEWSAGDKSCVAIRLILLSSSILPAQVLAQYALSQWWLDRYVVARHPNTDLATLEQLSRDGNRFVRAAARERLQEIPKEEEQIPNYD